MKFTCDCSSDLRLMGWAVRIHDEISTTHVRTSGKRETDDGLQVLGAWKVRQTTVHAGAKSAKSLICDLA